MINANELRIGNWITILRQYNQGGNYPYEIAHGHDIEEIEGNGEAVDPIPLTPEIFEKCGFVFNKNSLSYRVFSHKEEWILSAQQTMDKSCFKIGLPIDNRSDRYMTSLKSLHELQNLYFALTGKELEINLTEGTK